MASVEFYSIELLKSGQLYAQYDSTPDMPGSRLSEYANNEVW